MQSYMYFYLLARVDTWCMNKMLKWFKLKWKYKIGKVRIINFEIKNGKKIEW